MGSTGHRKADSSLEGREPNAGGSASTSQCTRGGGKRHRQFEATTGPQEPTTQDRGVRSVLAPGHAIDGVLSDTSTLAKTLLLALVVIAISFTASINKWLAGPIGDIVPPPGDGSPAFPHYLRNSTRL